MPYTDSTLLNDKKMNPFQGPFLVITRHDYRSRRKANMHFITEELSKRDKTRIFSFGFSALSYLKDDPRLLLWSRSNKQERVEGIDCYLWRTPLHPVNLRFNALRFLESFLFKRYVRSVPAIFRQWTLQSNTIVFESGFPVIFFRLCRAINPKAHFLYIASDSLHTVDCAPYIIKEFEAFAPELDGLRLPSHQLQRDMPAHCHSFFVPHGLDTSFAAHGDPSPYSEGSINAVSVGSMLFDPTFFEIAANAFPKITFHVIGGGAKAKKLSLPNIRIYGEMPFLQTIPYIKHAQVGIAPYNGAKVASYLVDTSMKLMQYGFMGIPAVCPETVVGSHFGRFGYRPGSYESIKKAMENALALGHFTGNPVLSWQEVTDRILNPLAFEDTKLSPV